MLSIRVGLGEPAAAEVFDVVAGFGYAIVTLRFKVVGGYDSIVEEGAIKARIDAKIGGVEAFVAAGWNTDGDKLKWNLQLVYTDTKIFEATTNVNFNLVKDLLVEPEVSYVHYDAINDDTVADILRFERNF